MGKDTGSTDLGVAFWVPHSNVSSVEVLTLVCSQDPVNWDFLTESAGRGVCLYCCSQNPRNHLAVGHEHLPLPLSFKVIKHTSEYNLET
jgi:hypothetical protein